MAETEINPNGYADLTTYIVGATGWKYIELQESNGTPILRREIGGVGTLATWENTTAPTLQVQIIVNGTDADVTLPKTFVKSALFKSSIGGTELCSNTYSSFTMVNTSDQLTVIHNIEIPDQA